MYEPDLGLFEKINSIDFESSLYADTRLSFRSRMGETLKGLKVNVFSFVGHISVLSTQLYHCSIKAARDQHVNG